MPRLSMAETAAPTNRRGPRALLRIYGPNALVLAFLGALAIWAFWFDGRWPRFTAAEPAGAEEIPVGLGPGQEDPDGGTAPSPYPLPHGGEGRVRGRRLEFASPDAVKRAGILCVRAESRSLAENVIANGMLHYDHTRVAHLSARVRGIAREVTKQVGQTVKEGDVLALIESPEIGKAKADLLRYLVLVEIKKQLYESMRPATVPERKIDEAEADLRQARIGLMNAAQALMSMGIAVSVEELQGLSDQRLVERVRVLGLPESYAPEKGTGLLISTNLVPLRAPFDGTVVGRDMVKGEFVGPRQVPFIIADLRTMHVHLSVRPADAAKVRLRQRARFVADGVPDLCADGEVEWISTKVDEKTRTVPVHVEVDNPDQRLRAHLYGTGTIRVRSVSGAVAVPEAAVQKADGCRRVFVCLSPTVFESRLVRTGIRDGGYVQIEEGVQAGEEVVTAGGPMLTAEIVTRQR